MTFLSRHRAAVAALIAGCLAAAPAADAAPRRAAPGPKSALVLPKLETFKLDNGLQVAFMHRDGAPVVSIEVWYHAGSKDEQPHRRGSAHMFEHIMFKGSQHVPPEVHAQEINRLGGYVNAQTTEDATHFFEILPSDYLDFAMSLEAERMRNLLFRKDMIDTEREVVKEEIRKNLNNPLVRGLETFLHTAYKVHPYAWTSGGTIADLDATTPADLKKFYDTYYIPNNALLVVVGNVTLDQVKAAAEKHFGPIPAGPTPPRPAASLQEPPQTAPRRATGDPSQIGLIIAGYKIPAAKHPDVYALQVLSLILGGGDSSRMMQEIKTLDPKTKRPLGIAAGTQVLIREDPGIFAAVGAFLDPGKAQAVEDMLLAQIKQVATKAPSAAEVRKAKNQIQASFVYGLENADGIAEQIGQSWILTGDPGQWLRDLDQFEKVTPADVQRVAKTYLDPKAVTVLVVPPPTPQPQPSATK